MHTIILQLSYRRKGILRKIRSAVCKSERKYPKRLPLQTAIENKNGERGTGNGEREDAGGAQFIATADGKTHVTLDLPVSTSLRYFSGTATYKTTACIPPTLNSKL